MTNVSKKDKIQLKLLQSDLQAEEYGQENNFGKQKPTRIIDTTCFLSESQQLSQSFPPTQKLGQLSRNGFKQK